MRTCQERNIAFSCLNFTKLSNYPISRRHKLMPCRGGGEGGVACCPVSFIVILGLGLRGSLFPLNLWLGLGEGPRVTCSL